MDGSLSHIHTLAVDQGRITTMCGCRSYGHRCCAVGQSVALRSRQAKNGYLGPALFVIGPASTDYLTDRMLATWFLTTSPNEVVVRMHPKAMPVILTTAEECDGCGRLGTKQSHCSGHYLTALRITLRGAEKENQLPREVSQAAPLR